MNELHVLDDDWAYQTWACLALTVVAVGVLVGIGGVVAWAIWKLVSGLR